MPSKKQILTKLEEVIDPELNINIVDLGLIYELKQVKKNLKIKMTFTTPACPLLGVMMNDIEEKMKEIGFEKVEVDIVWDPPWNPEMMTDKAKMLLGM
ncbi:metal-sulfur cluster assembly factor [Candidatus Micrarchaeota archaeon]|nr:metal-sulfur cluster assembly factor [Candidatus Micrarchaeota archaeon]